ncbi:peroxisomal membrane protein [Niveomyces insectorum RCEF 264]|uniref:Peroxisomal membrane protein n=1 Tax=Niveomyces insectorum RCEF 264 TaxID=1081102 RepID=A0A167PH69_9HYPO|nr:peroxisomal membrane protein [Niveomyces insectorum RCEF 264]
MFAATRRWFRRNRTPLAVGVGLVGAGYVAAQYVVAKINDARERMSSERIAKENLRRRFEQNQEDCTFTVLALLPTLTANVLDALNTEALTYQIQHLKTGGGAPRSVPSESGAASGSPPSIADTLATEDEGRGSLVSLPSESGVHASQVVQPGQAAAGAAAATADGAPQPAPAPAAKRKTKRQLWDELTISAVTRAYTLLYAVGLLVLLTRIQLNLLGRRSYLSSVVALATGSAQATISLENNDDDSLLQQQQQQQQQPQQNNNTDFEVNRKYLAFSWWLLHRSWADLAQRVEAAVRAAFGHLSPRDLVTLDQIADLTRQVRQTVERAPVLSTTSSSLSSSSSSSRWLPLVLPPPEREAFVLRESGILADSAAAAVEQQQQQQQSGEPKADHLSSSSTTPPPPIAPDDPVQTAALRRLLDETADLVESPAFAHVLTRLLDAGFATLLDHKIAPTAFGVPPPMPALFASEGEEPGGGGGGPAGSRQRPPPAHEQQQQQQAVQLPKVLSVLTRQAHVIGRGLPNEYLQEMEAVRELEAFAAVVYSSNWESALREDGLAAEAAAAAATDVEKDREAQTTLQAGQTAGTTTTITTQARVPAYGEGAAAAAANLSMVDDSLVMVDPAFSSLQSAWERAVDRS